METNYTFFRKNYVLILLVVLYVGLAAWWLLLNSYDSQVFNLHEKYVWGSLYQTIAFIAGVYGLIQSRKWGGFKSLLGKSIILFSLGLLFQCIGQTVYSYYNLVAQIEAPYPSLGDVGYFGSVILYIGAVLTLARVAGAHISFKSFAGKLQTIILPLIILFGSYYIFLQGYQFDFAQKIKIFLDLGYPLGQAFYVSVALLTLVLSRNVLGGIFQKPIQFFLLALIIQYVSDFNFLFHANNGTWYVGGFGDFMYMTSYFIMGLAIIQISKVFVDIAKN